MAGQSQPTKRVAAAIELAWPIRHHYEIYAGIQRYSREHQSWSCILDPYADQVLSNRASRPRYDGVVGRITAAMGQAARKVGVPVVNVWINSPVRWAPSVTHHARRSGELAARHLLDRGFRHFAFAGSLRLRSSQAALMGFDAVIGEAGFDCTALQVKSDYQDNAKSFMHFRADLAEWIATWPTPIGVFAYHDLMARYLVEACRESGLEVPHDVGVVGAENDTTICVHAPPTLTSIDFGFERVGYQAAQLLDHLMDGGAAPAEPILIEPAALCLRASSDAFVVSDPRVEQALRFIAAHSREPIRIEDVARAVKVTPRTLARLFDRTLGKTVYDEISRFRVEYIKRQLLNTDEPINTLALECGFSSPSHLSRLFYRLEGVRPGEYREQHRKRNRSVALEPDAE